MENATNGQNPLQSRRPEPPRSGLFVCTRRFIRDQAVGNVESPLSLPPSPRLRRAGGGSGRRAFRRLGEGVATPVTSSFPFGAKLVMRRGLHGSGLWALGPTEPRHGSERVGDNARHLSEVTSDTAPPLCTPARRRAAGRMRGFGSELPVAWGRDDAEPEAGFAAILQRTSFPSTWRGRLQTFSTFWPESCFEAHAGGPAH
jgi:hypothetical protein